MKLPYKKNLSNSWATISFSSKTLRQEDRYVVTQNRREISVSYETRGELICCEDMWQIECRTILQYNKF